MPNAERAVCGHAVRRRSHPGRRDLRRREPRCPATAARRRQVEPGWQCPTAGSKCIAKRCGDGILAGNEQCDDGNNTSGDGCSATCQIEPGYACVAQATAPNSVCHKTTCGDGVKEGSEECDDGNMKPYDGCSPSCEVEPKCAGGTCTAVCGDGLKFPSEGCDDGSVAPGDALQPDLHRRAGLLVHQHLAGAADAARHSDPLSRHAVFGHHQREPRLPELLLRRADGPNS